MNELEDEVGHKTVFHNHKGKKVPLRHHTSKMLHLAEALQKEMKTLRHDKNLQTALARLSRTRVRIVERIKKRGLF